MTEREFREKLFGPPTKESLASTTASSERTKLGYGLREDEGEDFWLFAAS